MWVCVYVVGLVVQNDLNILVTYCCSGGGGGGNGADESGIPYYT